MTFFGHVVDAIWNHYYLLCIPIKFAVAFRCVFVRKALINGIFPINFPPFKFNCNIRLTTKYLKNI